MVDVIGEDPVLGEVIAKKTGNTPKRDRTFPVVEIFGPTIQGEGSMIGVKTLFIRFGGCDYRCTKCDSMWAVEPQAVKKHARRMTAKQILEECEGLAGPTGCHWVTLSGGNPCMHQLDELVDLLHEHSLYVALETQGTLAPTWIRKCNVVTVSPKSPGMGEKFEPEKLMAFFDVLGPPIIMNPYLQSVSLKIVVFNQVDLEFALEVERMIEDSKEVTVQLEYYLSVGNPYPPELDQEFDMKDPQEILVGTPLPMTLLHEYRIMAEDICNDPRFGAWKLLPQLHVLVWHNESGR